MQIKFIKGTCGIGMAYFANDVANLPAEQAQLLVTGGYAVYTEEAKEEEELELAIQDAVREVPEKKRGRPSK